MPHSIYFNLLTEICKHFFPDRNIFGTARSLDLTMPQLGISFQTNHCKLKFGFTWALQVYKKKGLI